MPLEKVLCSEQYTQQIMKWLSDLWIHLMDWRPCCFQLSYCGVFTFDTWYYYERVKSQTDRPRPIGRIVYADIGVCTFKCNFNFKWNEFWRDCGHTTLYCPVTVECTLIRVVSDRVQRHAWATTGLTRRPSCTSASWCLDDDHNMT